MRGREGGREVGREEGREEGGKEGKGGDQGRGREGEKEREGWGKLERRMTYNLKPFHFLTFHPPFLPPRTHTTAHNMRHQPCKPTLQTRPYLAIVTQSELIIFQTFILALPDINMSQ